jgi:hypothetical protein
MEIVEEVDELPLVHCSDSVVVEIPLLSERFTSMVEFNPMVALAEGKSDSKGFSESTEPFIHVTGPSLPSRSTLRQPNMKL